jgi:Na+/H+ antiporter NhaA
MARFVIPLFAILGIFFVFQRDRMAEVWKPLLAYSVLAGIGFVVSDKLIARLRHPEKP